MNDKCHSVLPMEKYILICDGPFYSMFSRIVVHGKAVPSSVGAEVGNGLQVKWIKMKYAKKTCQSFIYCRILTSLISLLGKKKTLEWKVGASHGYDGDNPWNLWLE